MNDKGSAELRELEALMAIAREHNLDALLVEDGEYRVEIVRRESAPLAVDPVVPPPPVTHSSSNGAPTLPAVVIPVEQTPAGEQVIAPIVGIFYRAPSPTAPPFVNVGDRVSVGQTLCILEAMKLMNEITTEIAGIVTAIYPQNGDLVTIGQAMFHIVP